MRMQQARCIQARHVPVFLRSVLVVYILVCNSTHAENVLRPGPDIRGLVNQRFVGPMGVVGDPNPTQDEFIFKDGKFVSKSCLEWGFSPAPFWVRKAADGLHFLAELSSPDHGEMRYQGIYDGREIKGHVRWKKERWYWTIEREYKFVGRLPSPK